MATDELAAPTFPDGYEDFSGRHDRTLDDKGRVVLPAGEWREHFESGAKLTPWTGCLALWTRRSYRDVCAFMRARVRQGALEPGALEDFQEDAVDVRPDVQGRLQLPEGLRHEFGIGDKGASVVLSGQGDRVEVWALDRKRDRRAERPRAAYVDALRAQNY